MKNNKAMLLAICALLCLPACWCSKKKCSKSSCHQVEQVEPASKEVAHNDVDAFDPNELVLNEEVVLALNEITSEKNDSLNKF